MLEVAPGAVSGTRRAPRSKSETHRAILIASLADGPVTIHDPLLAADTRASAAAAAAFGCAIEEGGASVRVTPGAGEPIDGDDVRVDCGNSGTTLRLATGLAAARAGSTLLDGDASLRRRPMRPLIDALEEVGVRIESEDGRAPLRVHGRLSAGCRLRVDGSQSSQFISSLLLGLTAAGGGSVEVQGDPVSALYLEMTRRALIGAGVDVQWRARRDGREIVVPPRSRPRAGERAVPGDWSSAAFLLCGAALAGEVQIDGLPAPDEQADAAIAPFLTAMGASVESVPDGTGGASWRVGRRELAGIEVNVGGCPDLFPILAVTLAHADGRSRLHGAPHLRAKESDRIAMVVGNLRRQGVEVEEHRDGVTLAGGARLSGGPIETAGDHRILMAFAVGALRARRPVTFADRDPRAVTAVSYPTFLEDLAVLGVRLEER